MQPYHSYFTILFHIDTWNPSLSLSESGQRHFYEVSYLTEVKQTYWESLCGVS